MTNELLVDPAILNRACASNFFGVWAVHGPWLKAAHQQLAFVGIEAAIKMGVEQKAAKQAAAAAAGVEAAPYQMIGKVAVIGVDGPITKHETSMSAMFGGTSTVNVRNAMRRAASDPAVGSILLKIHSPGGSVSGVGDLADDVRAVRDVKPVIAFAEDVMASAAYWIGSQATHIVASPHAEVGSVGVYAQILDDSAKDEKEGIKIHTLKSTPKKAAGIPPVTDADLAIIQGNVNETHEMFVAAITAGRGDKMDAEAVATGEVWFAQKALSLGLIDSVGTIDEALALAQEAAGEAPLGAAVRRQKGGAAAAASASVGTPAPASVSVPSEATEPAPMHSDILLKGLPSSEEQSEELQMDTPMLADAGGASGSPPATLAASAPPKDPAAERIAALEAKTEELAKQLREKDAKLDGERLTSARERVVAAFPHTKDSIAKLVRAPEDADALIESLRGARASTNVELAVLASQEEKDAGIPNVHEITMKNLKAKKGGR